NHVTINGPIGGFIIPNSLSCLRPDTFLAVDTSKIEAGVAKSLRWDLYYDTDATLSNSLQTSFADPGSLICNQYDKYTVRLIITGNNGCKDTVIKKTGITIQKIIPKFTWTPKPACPAEVVQFNDLTARGTSKTPNRYRWTFYDNTNTNVMAKDTVQNPKLSYPDTGHYSVKLLVFNNLGCQDSITIDREVLIERPIPNFIISDSNACYRKLVGLKARYNDSGYYSTYNHRWLFQHKDSVNTKYAFNGDSITVSLLPGTYIIKYTRFSIRNTCRDTLLLPFQLKVSGIHYIPTTDPVKVCNPFNANLVAKASYDYNYKNGNSSPYTYNWSHQYDTNRVAIRQPNSNPSKVFVKKSGYFFFKFKYTHPSGCNDSGYTTTLTSGVVASFTPNGGLYYACVDRALSLINRSDKDAIKFKWFMKDSGSGAYFLPSDTSKNVNVIFKNEGVYKLGLIAYGSGDCTDTIITSLNSNDIRARFSSDDTLNYCAPVIARITAQKHPAILNYKWYLGDGDSVTNNLSNFGYLYKQNTGPDGSDVKLIVYGYGCNDTLDKKGYIKVIGPIPKFQLNNNVGCEKLRVQFVNQSKYYKRFFLEYGDGSVLDSVNFNTHIYQIFDRSLPYQKFKPTLSIIDSFGCLVQYENDTVFVLKAPEPKFSVNNDTGCADLTVSFTNRSIGGVAFKWDFENDGIIDNQVFAPKHTYPPGEFNPSLIARASNGCQDTIRNVVAIKSYQRPDVKFTASPDTICYNGNINFAANNTPSNSDIKRWEWNFGDPTTLTDTAYTQNPSYKFKKLYLSQVVLLVTDKNNCTDTFDRFIYTNDTFGPTSRQINNVTVTNNQYIDVNWGQSGFKEFTGYKLYNDNAPNYNLVYSTGLIKDTTYRISTGIDVNTNRYCYVLKTQDKCNNLGPVTYPHCTIFLQVTDTAVSDLILDWLPYEGWGNGNVRKYRIYRSESGGSFKLLDSVVSSENTYRDRKLCNKTYCYFVEAVDITGKWYSRSNSVCKSSLYIPPSIPVNAIRTTVLPNNATYTQWNKYTYAKYVDHYGIGRSASGFGSDDYYAHSDSLGFIDLDKFMETNRVSYTYTIRVVDHCGIESPTNPISKTILLGGKSEGYVAKLQWSAYEKWFSGVKQYQVMVREDNTFKIIGSIDTASSVYSFDFMDTKLDDSICFKIQAIKDTSVFVESFSNVLCLISDAKIFIPNAFTPNQDGKNEVFIPRAILIFNQTGNPILDYHLEIYNRWGEQVFFSDDVNQGWDGTFKGVLCPEGHYVYKVRALALDGVTSFNLEGVFVLLR
ncbi:MAG: gliding motility-associated C-terminal domain-containing protein, partial [Bacteroidia bacterium]|nr:gliding motility-associated C-terminal domain-containing protein [Bacteroidia bacterium]